MTPAVQQRLDYRSTKKPKTQPVPFFPGPNPDLPKFIAEHSTPYDPKIDTYDVPAFDRDIEVNKATPPRAILNMHRYWSKKHWAAIREYIHHYLPQKYYPEGSGLVLDCFAGSGMTGVAASMENRSSVLIDVSPVAAFMSYCYTHAVETESLQSAYDAMMAGLYPQELQKQLKTATGEDIKNLREELDWLYATKCDRCGGDAETEYVVYSQRFQCPRCGEVVALIDCPEVKVSYPVGSVSKQTTEMKRRRVCPHCMKTHHEPHRDFVISTRSKTFGSVPVLVNYACKNGCNPSVAERVHNEPRNTRKAKFFAEYDLPKLRRLEKAEIPHWYPNRDMIAGWETRHKRRLDLQGIIKVADLYTRRNLWALAAIAVQANKPLLRLALSATSIGLSRMQLYSPGSTFPNMIISGTYYIPQMTKQYKVGAWYEGKVAAVITANRALAEVLNGAAIVSAESALNPMPNEVADYIFTDPAYVGNIQYGELNFVWEAWLDFDSTWLQDEIVVNPFRNKSVDDWDRDIRIALRNCYRALKPGRWLSLCYHDANPSTWARIQNIILDTGFEIHTVTVLDPKQKSSNQIMSEKVVKSDLVLNCLKPKSGQLDLQIKDSEVPPSIRDRVRTILEDTLSEHPGLTRDKLFDIVTRRLLERAQMVEFQFEEILAQIATKAEGDRWYLKAELEQLSKNDLANEEKAGEALTRFTQLRCIGAPAKHAAEIALSYRKLCETNSKGGLDERAIEDWINDHLAKEDKELLARKKIKRLELGGALAGIEFYDALFFYFTRYMKGKRAQQLPKRNLAEFLEEYLVHFKDGDKWLYRAPEARETEELRKGRQSGLGRRIRAFANALRDNDREYIDQHRPDVKTFVEWMRYCATFGRNEDGVVLFDKGGLAVHELKSVVIDEAEEETAYDAASSFAALCKRRLGPTAEGVEAEDVDTGDEED
ncbi:MAG TPA: hypothetical protein VMP11_03720 [Verrucomicrobiae bacterium]|nr:hypothetical protein [Verrucomicrobiae bacterium]